MSRASKILIILGLFTAIIPMLGVPGIMKDWLTVVMGLAIAVIIYWEEKHTRFCPECRLPESVPHGHDKNRTVSVLGDAPSDASRQQAAESNFARGVIENDVRLQQETSQAEHTPSPLSLSPSPFDAEKKSYKSRKGGQRKTALVE